MSSGCITTSNFTTDELTSIKIVDKCSCYVIGLKTEIANYQTLTDKSYFGQFDGLIFIRFIRHKIPCQAYIKFDNELSAKAAINWCQNQTISISARHGYWKYCNNFIANKICKKKNCHYKHSWCDRNDVIISNNKDESPKKTKKKKNHQNKMKKINKKINKKQDMIQDQINLLQSRCNTLQCQYTEQNKLIHTLLYQLQALKLENESLKLENKQLVTATINNKNNGWNLKIDEIVDVVIRNDHNDKNQFNLNCLNCLNSGNSLNSLNSGNSLNSLNSLSSLNSLNSEHKVSHQN